MLITRVWRVRDACERSCNFAGGILPFEKNPESGMDAKDKRHHSRNGAHGSSNHARLKSRDRTCPPRSTKSVRKVPQLKMDLQVAAAHGRFKTPNKSARQQKRSAPI